jgi:hypothetical protein
MSWPDAQSPRLTIVCTRLVRLGVCCVVVLWFWVGQDGMAQFTLEVKPEEDDNWLFPGQLNAALLPVLYAQIREVSG